MYLLDTSAVLELLYGTIKGEEIDKIIGDNITLTSSITVHEVAVGEYEDSLNEVLEFFNRIEVLPFDKEAALKSFLIERELSKRGAMINKSDIFIAGICQQHNLTLITLDRDFQKISSIKSIVI